MTESFPVKDFRDVRDDFLRYYANGLRKSGIANPNVDARSEPYAFASALAGEIVVGMASLQTLGDEFMPDTAPEARLLRIGRVHELAPRPAAGSAGALVVKSLGIGAIAVPTGARFVDTAGQSFEAPRGGLYVDGALLPVRALATGPATNHTAGDRLKWTAAPLYAELELLVAQGGLRGGRDAEDLETFRQRVLARYRAPTTYGNAQAIAEFCEEASARVQKAFVYPVLRGPSSFGVSVVGYADALTRDRSLDDATLQGEILPYLLARLPEFVAFDVTTARGLRSSVSLRLVLPSARTASPPGPGGGWVNGSPWPAPDTTRGTADVVDVTSSGAFRVRAAPAYPPTPGITEVSWISRSGADPWSLLTATVLSFQESAPGLYDLVLDAPFPGVAPGDFVFPATEQGDAYLATLLDAFGRLGPGERAPASWSFSRAYRKPGVLVDWPSALGPYPLSRLTQAHPEISSAAWLSRSIPEPPTSNRAAPFLLLPDRIAFYP